MKNKIIVTQNIDGRSQFYEEEAQISIEYENDLLVEVKAIAINPVDVKIASSLDNEVKRVLGWDASGIVISVGKNVRDFKIGDKVFYAGNLNRSGSYSSYQLVDSRLVGKSPNSLSYSESASLPLTSLTAWEALFERLNIPLSKEDNTNKTILIIGGAGGVGSIAIQLAKMVGLNVIATASKDKSIQWVSSLGADKVINHYQNFLTQTGHEVEYILCLNSTDQHWFAMEEVIQAQGKICSIVETNKEINLDNLQSKSVSFSWEFMFTRSMYNTPDIERQGQILNEISKLIDNGTIRHTLNKKYIGFNTTNIADSHKDLLTGSTIGKVVIEY